jgi:hypothetical protein
MLGHTGASQGSGRVAEPPNKFKGLGWWNSKREATCLLHRTQGGQSFSRKGHRGLLSFSETRQQCGKLQTSLLSSRPERLQTSQQQMPQASVAGVGTAGGLLLTFPHRLKVHLVSS